MYSSFFRFRENPFNLTPDPRYLFLSPSHKEALEGLLDAIEKRKGLITATGAIGTGKTTLCRAVLNKLDTPTKSALIFNSFISDIELLVTLSREFGVETSSKAQTKKDHFSALNRFLLGTFRRDGNAVLLIDEAQNLPHSALERILMLSELEEAGEKLLQIILVGQTELSDVLALHSLKPLSERIKTSYSLKPLEPNDIGGYIEHRLEVAGGRGNVQFTEGALRRVYGYTGGNPRRINAVCDRALLIAYVRETHTITKRMVGTAIQELKPEAKTKPAGFQEWPWKRFASSYALPLFLIIVAGLAGWTLMEKILWKFPDEKKIDVPKIVKPIPLRSQPKAINRQAKASLVPSYEQTHRPQREGPQSESSDFISIRPFHQIQRKDESVVPKALDIRKNGPSRRADFSVQVGAFLSKGNAERLVADLKKKGYEPYLSAFLGYGRRKWYSVRILDCANLKDAEQAVSEYRRKEGRPAIVTRWDSLTPATGE